MAPTSYTIQTWDGEVKIHDDITGLSIEAAREIALAHAAMGYTARVMSDSDDYCEVYKRRERRRTGTFAQVTQVIVEGGI